MQNKNTRACGNHAILLGAAEIFIPFPSEEWKLNVFKSKIYQKCSIVKIDDFFMCLFLFILFAWNCDQNFFQKKKKVKFYRNYRGQFENQFLNVCKIDFCGRLGRKKHFRNQIIAILLLFCIFYTGLLSFYLVNWICIWFYIDYIINISNYIYLLKTLRASAH